MADFQALFHNPESLTDGDLKKIFWKMKVQSYFPYLTAGMGGAAMFFADTTFFKRAMCFKRVGVMSFGGFMLGASLSYSLLTSKAPSNFSESAETNFD
tara:strand:+ start:8 stop:301 length:294 start_codon:yes stop_codon:yes gene_type:complete